MYLLPDMISKTQKGKKEMLQVASMKLMELTLASREGYKTQNEEKYNKDFYIEKQITSIRNNFITQRHRENNRTRKPSKIFSHHGSEFCDILSPTLYQVNHGAELTRSSIFLPANELIRKGVLQEDDEMSNRI